MSMDDRVYFIEGIHGAGKSTCARRLLRRLGEETGKRVFFRSEKPSPLDLDRLAFFDDDELQEFIGICEAAGSLTGEWLARELERFSAWEEERCAVNWLGFCAACGCDDPRAREFALSHELCAGKAGLERYEELTLRRWRRFSRERDPEAYYLFEGTVFQHPLAELLGNYAAGDEEIVRFVREMLACMPGVVPTLIYIRVSDVEGALLNAAAERESGEYSWRRGFCRWIETCAYGRVHRLSGMAGAVRYCEERMRLEKLLMEDLPVKLKIIDR